MLTAKAAEVGKITKRAANLGLFRHLLLFRPTGRSASIKSEGTGSHTNLRHALHCNQGYGRDAGNRFGLWNVRAMLPPRKRSSRRGPDLAVDGSD
ncbi:MAG: hypothetical protein JKP98_18225 [Rhodobacteraceae bacterium]|jgi:hypothetical protein|nr:hypothetical protein [Paracoccaceae bacterium]MBL4558285.1 hypothetical protein [Paracoccaceae bacterium]